MFNFKNENKFSPTASTIFALASLASFVGGLALIFKWFSEYALTGFALVSLAVFLFSIIMLFFRYENPNQQRDSLNKQSDSWRRNLWVVFWVSLGTLVVFGWLAAVTEFGT